MFIFIININKIKTANDTNYTTTINAATTPTTTNSTDDININ